MHAIISRSAVAAAIAAMLTSIAPYTMQAQTITACSATKSGSMYRVGITGAPTDCTNSTHTKATWNIQGPQGPQGPAGAIKLPFDSSMNYTGNMLSLKNTGNGGVAFFGANVGTAVFARSYSGAAVNAQAWNAGPNSAAVRAEHLQTTGVALNVAKGAIRVQGAGYGSQTAVTAVNSNLAERETFTGSLHVYKRFFIDNPHCNGDPTAIVMATVRRRSTGIPATSIPPIFTEYRSDKGKWAVVYEPDVDELVADFYFFDFNVMCIKS